MRKKRDIIDKDILEKALDAFKRVTSINAMVQKALFGPDKVLYVWQENKKWIFTVEVRENVTRTLIGIIYHQRLLNPQQKDSILVTRYVNPRIAELMKENEIAFIDTAGNAYINKPPLFIFVKGNKIPEEDLLKPATRVFRPTGLQVVFAILCNTGLENTTYRKIAEKAGVALGTVGWVFRDLKEMGYLVDMGKRGRRLNDKFNLFIRWVNAYPEELKPKKFIGRYRTENYYWWQDTELEEYHAYWGGEVAASMLTNYLKPENITIYTRQPLGDFMLKHKLRKDPKGNIEVFKVFWEFEYQWKYNNIVPPFLIYADLLATGDTRNIETAAIIYEKELTRFIREN